MAKIKPDTRGLYDICRQRLFICVGLVLLQHFTYFFTFVMEMKKSDKTRM